MVADGGEKLRSFLQPLHLRRVALVILIGWVIPLIGALGAGMVLAGEFEAGKGEGSHSGTKLQAGIKPTSQQLIANSNRNNKTRTAQKAERGSEGINSNFGDQEQVGRDKSSPPPVAVVQENGIQTSNQVAGDQASTITGRGAQGERTTSRPSKVDEGQVYLLARVIYAEARGEPFEGQVAVGAVLVNRLRSSRFPNNLWGIIFGKGEFCTVRDGQVWLTPSNEAYRAARLALSGWDPSKGALFFYNPAKTTSNWIWSRPVTAKIGNHVFAR